MSNCLENTPICCENRDTAFVLRNTVNFIANVTTYCMKSR